MHYVYRAWNTEYGSTLRLTNHACMILIYMLCAVPKDLLNYVCKSLIVPINNQNNSLHVMLSILFPKALYYNTIFTPTTVSFTLTRNKKH